MTQAFIEYGLFLAKTLTLFLIVGALLITLVRSRRGYQADGDRLEVIDLNGKYRDMARTLKRASLPKKAFLKALKRDRKARKGRDKAGDGKQRRRIFVIDFHGDIKATEVASLREIVTGVLMEIGEG
ncbi:MAG: protease SohB, partial [Chromatiaceae bacterium]|nr:protease SohB [Chromatiaceae bacterium]